jgi:hypothetical protein
VWAKEVGAVGRKAYARNQNNAPREAASQTNSWKHACAGPRLHPTGGTTEQLRRNQKNRALRVVASVKFAEFAEYLYFIRGKKGISSVQLDSELYLFFQEVNRHY